MFNFAANSIVTDHTIVGQEENRKIRLQSSGDGCFGIYEGRRGDSLFNSDFGRKLILVVE